MTAKRQRRQKRPAITVDGENWLRGEDGGAWTYFESDLAKFWKENGAAILAEHILRSPGSRPIRWWQFEAPEPRRRLGGRGTPLHEVSAYALMLHFGLPVFWRTWGDGFGRGTPVDPYDPPLFEGEGLYLTRLGLLQPGEKPSRKALKPVAIRVNSEGALDQFTASNRPVP